MRKVPAWSSVMSVGFREQAPPRPFEPAGGRRLVTDAVGVEMSVVNGVVATRQGSSTGARPGRRLRPVAP